MRDLSDDVIAAHVEHGPQIPSVQSTLHIYPTDGAVQRIGAEDTAYSHRDAKFVHIIAATSPDPADMPQGTDWARRYWQALHPHATGGAYVNFLTDDGPDPVRLSYGQNFARLVALKNKYDPTNLFRLNQNIKPTV